MQAPLGFRSRHNPVFALPPFPPFTLSVSFLINLAFWWVQLWFAPGTFLVKWAYSKLAPFALPPVEFLWRNKFNFLKATVLGGFYVCTTIFIAMFSYYVVRSYFIVKEHSYDSLHFDFNSPLPVAVVKFNGGSLVHGQPYNAIIELELPESPPNIELGMFMITLQLISDEDNGSLIIESSRPCILRYKTRLLRAVHTLSFSLPSLVGLYEQKQNLEVSLAEDIIPSKSYSGVRAVVALSKADIQLYSSTLHIRASLSWLSYFIMRWPITSFFIGTALLSLFHSPWIFILFLILYMRVTTSRRPATPTRRPATPPRAGRLIGEELETARPAAPAHEDMWGILDEVEEEGEEVDREREEERRELEERLQERLAERRREREEEERAAMAEDAESGRAEGGESSGVGKGKERVVEEDEDVSTREGSRSSSEENSGEWVEVDKDVGLDEDEEEEDEDEEAESSSSLRRRRG